MKEASLPYSYEHRRSRRRPAALKWSNWYLSILKLAVGLLLSQQIVRLVGMNTLKAFSKLVMVLLAAIAVNFIRTGIADAIREMK